MSPAEVRHHFADYPFGEPCKLAEIARAESLLGQPIPTVLRDLYINFDGFLGPTGASFLWPLFEKKPGRGALVEMNRFLRDDDIFPKALTSKCLFYGDAGVGSQWGVKADLAGKIVLWDAEWGEDFEIVGTDILEVWLEEKRKYDELASQ
jgi:hypothetical protein